MNTVAAPRIENRKLIFFFLALAGLASLLYLIMLNSGMGYDALLYLIIGEDWGKGIPPYSRYVEIKPIGIFLLDRAILAVSRSPYWINSVVLGIDLTFVAAAILCVSQGLSRAQRMLLGVCLLSLGFLTEMSYLITDTPMAICGMLGFRMFWPSALEKRPSVIKMPFLAGMAFGISFLFKAAAAFYVLAGIVALAMKPCRNWPEMRTALVVWLRSALFVGAGIAVPFGLAALWAQSHGLLQRMLFLTIWVPLFHFPPHQGFLLPFIGKLGPFLGLWLAAVVYWFVSPQDADRERRTWQRWLLIFSIFGAGQLFKNQGSHYLIASLPFMTAFIISVGSPAIRRMPRRFVPMLTTCALAGICLFVVAFREKLLPKLHSPDFSVERRLANGIVALSRPGEQALFINGIKSSCHSYWITGLRPPQSWQYLAIDLYSYGLADSHQGQLVASLRDSQTTLVTMIPELSPSYLGWPWPFSQDEFREAQRILHERFEPVDAVNGVLTPGLWKLKGRAPDFSIRAASGPYAD